MTFLIILMILSLGIMAGVATHLLGEKGERDTVSRGRFDKRDPKP